MLYYSLKQLRTYFRNECKGWLPSKNIYIGNPPKGLIPIGNMPAVVIEPDTTIWETEDNQRDQAFYNIVVSIVINERQHRNPEKVFENNALTDIAEFMEGGDKSTIDYRDDSIVAVLLNAKQDGIGQNWWVWAVGDVNYGVALRGEIHTREAQVRVQISKLKNRTI